VGGLILEKVTRERRLRDFYMFFKYINFFKKSRRLLEIAGNFPTIPLDSFGHCATLPTFGLISHGMD
jgi:hypothetical protein